MASANWKKIKYIKAVKAMLRHSDKDQRLMHKHDNPDIDIARTGDNLQIYDYKTACDRLDSRIAYLDAQKGANKRSDRVIAVGIEIPLPLKLCTADRETQIKWFNRVHGIICDAHNGAHNCIGTYIHYDEIHDYIDSNGDTVTSRAHLHEYFVAEIGGKLNCKAFSGRANIISLNNDIEQMTQQEFGCKWNTGTKTKSSRSVQSLKNDSRQRELDIKAQEIEQQATQTEQDRASILAEAREAADQIKEEACEAADQIRAEATEEADIIRARSARLSKAYITDRSLRIKNAAKAVYNKADRTGITREQVVGDYGQDSTDRGA